MRPHSHTARGPYHPAHSIRDKHPPGPSYPSPLRERARAPAPACGAHWHRAPPPHWNTRPTFLEPLPNEMVAKLHAAPPLQWYRPPAPDGPTPDNVKALGELLELAKVTAGRQPE